MKKPYKLYVVKKYIYAHDAQQAIKKERDHKVDDVWWDDDHKKKMTEPKDVIGFIQEHE